MDMSSGSSDGPLTDSGVDFSNYTQRLDFLADILDDTQLQVQGNAAARRFWYGIVAVIGVATLCNVVHTSIQRSRLQASLKNEKQPARPSSLPIRWIATTTATLREIAYLQPYLPVLEPWIRIPDLGAIWMVAAYLLFILLLEFVDNDVTGAQYYQALSVQAAWLAVAQIPLIVLLAGKNSLVGVLSGTSYQRLNVLHRWVARGSLLLSTFHFGFQSYGWQQYGVEKLEWATDSCPPTGIAAYAILLWMNLTTFAPMRYYAYNWFVFQHIITYFGFIIAVMMHLPSTALYSRVYVYIAIALYLLERLVRTARYALANLRPARATLHSLDDARATKIHIRGSSIKRWAPGDHVLLALPRFGLAQSHPATILSTPDSHQGDLVLILRTFSGFTRRIATAAAAAPAAQPDNHDPEAVCEKQYLALIEGPYPAASQTDFACYDTLFLVAGGTGVTFTLSVLLSLAARAQTTPTLPLRNVQFVWIVKDRASLSWIRQELLDVLPAFENAGITLEIKAFLTCDSPDSAGKSTCTCAGDCGCCIAEKDSNVMQKDPNSASSSIEVVPPWSEINYQRPEIDSLLWDGLCAAQGESAIAVAGPRRLSAAVRRTVVQISDERAVHKGTGAQGIYLHVENCN
ncbi:hypothetical protein ASPZODRAFT_2049685 [Penicilliopsis zonata CBS 506.65]|uniref:FAD-binding FR-type domain-containing protein n=1 Tax=Penicilliopsis zonata CBS 506.65 TaxID=1073090 RepID=A0A1L9SFW5_9EURO|nr:hypothetical protein ASPZODRAFT_2049685 [Penicilliopsis zonata CBS 506.65]OJJ46062.1 hypothetical protein ASPZODRAFT_2049685 [Penicilliopsis zonata CBS 506.65]